MVFRVLADLAVFVHLAFVVFVVVGGLLVWRWRWIVWLHVPAVLWAVGIEWSGEVCPLTPLENWLRIRAGLETYPGDFLGRYALGLLYPGQMTRAVQYVLGALALGLNLIIYVAGWKKWKRSKR